jgi:hypothetical protein
VKRWLERSFSDRQHATDTRIGEHKDGCGSWKEVST